MNVRLANLRALWPARRGPGGRRFTLVEMIVSLGVLMVVMAVLFGTIRQTQWLWRIQRSRMEVYENARVVFDLVTRDLQGVVISQAPAIWYASAVGGEPTFRMALVTSSGIGISPSSDSVELAEVVYEVQSDSTVARWLTAYHHGTVWNFYNTHPDIWAARASLGDSEIIAGGVEDLTFRFFDDTGNPVALADSVPPSRVEVQLTLFDPGMNDPNTPELLKAQRTFVKQIFTNRGYRQ